jgi:hypothetical protein
MQVSTIGTGSTTDIAGLPFAVSGGDCCGAVNWSSPLSPHHEPYLTTDLCWAFKRFA